VKRLVERPFGEVLFASAIVIGDGGTERAFLPPLFRHALGALGHGIVVVDPDSMSKAQPLVKLADAIDLPWYLFVDRDGPGVSDASKICEQFDDQDSHGAERRVFVMDTRGATEAMLRQHDPEMCRRAVVQVRPDLADSTDDLPSLMGQVKGVAGGAYASELITAYVDPADWPDGLRTLIRTLEIALRPAAGGTDEA